MIQTYISRFVMQTINTPWQLGSLLLPHRLIQGPLAGTSCAPFRELFTHFKPPAFCVTEMCSAMDVLNKHSLQSRYLYRSPKEQVLAYQISGTHPLIMAKAASLLQSHGADLIDINCGCPKNKIRKKGAGSALLENPEKLISIIKAIRSAISIPLTVKIRIQGTQDDVLLGQQIEEAGADALIVHGRRWIDDYDVACSFEQIAEIKKNLSIPVIANGDIRNQASLEKAMNLSACDAWMISRGGCGRPWIYEELLEEKKIELSFSHKINLFFQHLEGLALLENEFKAVLQSKSLVRYYFRQELVKEELDQFYALVSLVGIKSYFEQRSYLELGAG